MPYLPLSGMSGAQRLRGSRKNVRAKARRRLGRGHVAQQLVGAAEFRVQAPGLRILQQQARKHSALRDGQFAVEIGLNQFLELALVHGHRTPRVASCSFRSCRAVYRRDLTVFASIPRISPMSS